MASVWFESDLHTYGEHKISYRLEKLVELPFRPTLDYDYVFADDMRMNPFSITYNIDGDVWTVYGGCWIDAGALADALAIACARGWKAYRNDR